MEQFDEFGFPSEYPPELLSRMRSQLHLSAEEFRQLHLCFDAASNLYAIISLDKLYDLCCRYLPPISREDFLDATEIIAHECGNPYAIVRREIFHDELPPGGPMDRELVAEHLYAVGDEYYYVLEEGQEGKPWYVPDWSEFVKYADQFYIESTPQQHLLTRYLQNTQRKLHCPPTEITEEFCSFLKMGEDIQYIIDEGQRLGVRFQNRQDFRDFLNLLLKLSHHTRRYIHRGHTPAELELPVQTVEDVLDQLSYDNDYVDPLDKMGQMLCTNLCNPTTISGKPSRNAPCPCGSGRKYKNCCGK